MKMLYRTAGLRGAYSDPRSTPVDPYGWEGAEPDLWASRPEGTESVWLWKEGHAPALHCLLFSGNCLF